MKLTPFVNASDFEYAGRQIDERRVEIDLIVDRRDKVSYNFTDSVVGGYLPGFRSENLSDYRLTIQDDTFLRVKSRPGGPPVPDMLTIDLPIMEADNFTARNTMRLLTMEAMQ